MTSTLARNLLLPPATEPRVPRIAIVFPLEGKVDLAVECRDSERSRLFFYVLADERKVDLIERAFELGEDEA